MKRLGVMLFTLVLSICLAAVAQDASTQQPSGSTSASTTKTKGAKLEHLKGKISDDGKSFKWIAFRSAATPLGQTLLASGADARWWLAGTIKRDEWNGGNAAEMHLEDAALA